MSLETDLEGITQQKYYFAAAPRILDLVDPEENAVLHNCLMYIVAGYPEPNITLLQDGEPLNVRKGNIFNVQMTSVLCPAIDTPCFRLLLKTTTCNDIYVTAAGSFTVRPRGFPARSL